MPADCSGAVESRLSPVEAAIAAFEAHEPEFERLSQAHTAAEEATRALRDQYGRPDAEFERLFGVPARKIMDEPYPADFVAAEKAEAKAERAYIRAADKRRRLVKAIIGAPHRDRAEAVRKLDFYALANGAKAPENLSFEEDLAPALAVAMKELRGSVRSPAPSATSPLAYHLAEFRRLHAESLAQDDDVLALLEEADARALFILAAPIRTTADALVKLEMATERFHECAYQRLDGAPEDQARVNLWAIQLAEQAHAFLSTGKAPILTDHARAYLISEGCIVHRDGYRTPEGLSGEVDAYLESLTKAERDALLASAETSMFPDPETLPEPRVEAGMAAE